MIDWMIGKPYSFRNFNCWHYAVALRGQVGIDTPTFKPKSIAEAFDIIEDQVKKTEHGLTKVEFPENFDVLIGSTILKGKKVFHCGVWYNDHVMHCCLAAKQVRRQSYKEFKEEFEAVSIWR